MESKKTTAKEYCQFCHKDYQAEVWTVIYGIPATKGHNCEQQKALEKARASIKYV